MPQLDIITYFSQSFWFTLLFWIGLFYFLYDLFPFYVNLFKVREYFKVNLHEKVIGFNKYFEKQIIIFNLLGQKYNLKGFRVKDDLVIQNNYLIKYNLNIYKIFNIYYILNKNLKND